MIVNEYVIVNRAIEDGIGMGIHSYKRWLDKNGKDTSDDTFDEVMLGESIRNEIMLQLFEVVKFNQDEIYPDESI